MALGYCDIVCIAGIYSGGCGAVGNKEVIEGWGEHRALGDPTPHDASTRGAREVLTGGCSAPQVIGEPTDGIRVEFTVADFGKEDGMVY